VKLPSASHLGHYRWSYACRVIPEALTQWTLDVVRALVDQGVFETDRFDFKEMLPDARDDAGKRRLRRDVPAFANSGGGFLVFGVKNDRGLAAVDRLVGVPDTVDLPEQFGNYPKASEPSVAWDFANPPIPLSAGRVIHVFHVPPSALKPHGVFEDERWWFPKRTNKGTEAMTYSELRAAFSATREKLAKLRMLISEVQHLHDQAHVVNVRAAQSGRAGWRGAAPGAYDYSTVAALMPDVADLLAARPGILQLLPRLRSDVRAAEDSRKEPSFARINQMNAGMAAHWFGGTARQIVQTTNLLLPLLQEAAAAAER